MRLAVRLPEGEDLNEWLAVHGMVPLLLSNVRPSDLLLSTSPFLHSLRSGRPSVAVDFFNHLNMLYGTVTEFCTPQEVRIPVSILPQEHRFAFPWVTLCDALKVLSFIVSDHVRWPKVSSVISIATTPRPSNRKANARC